jgi:Flp pilus assembly pilin Flp
LSGGIIMNLNNKGQVLTEYVLLVTFVSLAIISGLLIFNPAISSHYSHIINIVSSIIP